MTKQDRQPTHEEIATEAYYLWEADGRPHGRDWEYWMKAKDILLMRQKIEVVKPQKRAPRFEAKTPKRRQTTLRVVA